MNPFDAFRRRSRIDADIRDVARKASEEKKRERERACYDALTKVLEAHRCEIRPVLLYLPHGVLPDVQIYALSDEEVAKRNEQPTDNPDAPESGTAAPGEAGVQADASTAAPEPAGTPADTGAAGSTSAASK